MMNFITDRHGDRDKVGDEGREVGRKGKGLRDKGVRVMYIIKKLREKLRKKKYHYQKTINNVLFNGVSLNSLRTHNKV